MPTDNSGDKKAPSLGLECASSGEAGFHGS
jgi:hypothetical protein